MTSFESAARLTGSAHDRRVAALYGREADRWFEFSRRMGHRPYNTWGLWSPGVQHFDAAFAALIGEVVRRARIAPSHRVLDVACGGGATSLDLHLLTGCRVLGIDLAEPFLKNGRSMLETRAAPSAVDLRAMSATALGLEPESFEAVVVIDAACHFTSKSDFFSQAARVLAPCGKLVMLDIVAGSDEPRRLYRLLALLMMRAWRIPSCNRMSASGLQRALERAGYRVESIEPDGERILLPAVRAMQGSEFRRHYRDVYGTWADWSWQGMVRLLAWMHRRGIFEYVWVVAERLESTSGAAA